MAAATKPGPSILLLLLLLFFLLLFLSIPGSTVELRYVYSMYANESSLGQNGNKFTLDRRLVGFALLVAVKKKIQNLSAVAFLASLRCIAEFYCTRDEWKYKHGHGGNSAVGVSLDRDAEEERPRFPRRGRCNNQHEEDRHPVRCKETKFSSSLSHVKKVGARSMRRWVRRGSHKLTAARASNHNQCLNK